MTTVSAPARLHFGLLHVPAGDGGRSFGGCGLMVAAPRVVVTVERAADWSAAGPAADRALGFARRATGLLGSGAPLAVAVRDCPAEHGGLGVGTALGLAVARAVLAELAPETPPTAETLARLAGRGDRSAVGAHGFARGGFVTDGGKLHPDRLGALVARHDFPAWPVVLALPRAAGAWHGPVERQAFARPRDPAAAADLAGRMCRTLLLGVLPALADRDYPAFADALHDYNRLAGEPFAADQGGVYGSPAVAARVAAARAAGGRAAGQSSWGPATFAVCPDPAAAAAVAHAWRASDPAADVVVTAADNAGAAVDPGAPPAAR